jgi:protein-S-isoprenylcysteine O-methyltransferase Ste14
MDLIGKTPIHPILFYSGKMMGYLTWIILLLMIFDVDLINRISFNYNDSLAFVVLFIGLVFIVFSLIHLGSSTRLGLPTDETVFKTNGLYRISRNPMYVGFNLLTIASMIYTLHWGVILLGLYSMVIYHLIILGEERFLMNRFGEEYLTYKNKIRRYL